MEQDAQGIARSAGRSQGRGPRRMATRLTCRYRARYRASSRHSLNRESLSLRWIQVAVYVHACGDSQVKQCTARCHCACARTCITRAIPRVTLTRPTFLSAHAL